MAMTKVAVVTTEAPAAIGPYAQAMVVGEMVYTSGQIALDPRTMELVEGGITEQTMQVLRNLGAVLEAAGSDLTQVVKTLVFLQDLGDFAAMNAVYAGFFPGDAVAGAVDAGASSARSISVPPARSIAAPPARSTVEVAGLPKGALVEIEVIALVAAPSSRLGFGQGGR